MSKIQLTVTGAALHLPNVRPHGKRFMRPGTHTIPEAHWDAVKNHAAVRAWLKSGRLVEGAAVAEPPEPPDPLSALRDMTVSEAQPHIDASSNRDELARWRNADRRKGIHEAIDDRLAELDDD